MTTLSPTPMMMVLRSTCLTKDAVCNWKSPENSYITMVYRANWPRRLHHSTCPLNPVVLTAIRKADDEAKERREQAEVEQNSPSTPRRSWNEQVKRGTTRSSKEPPGQAWNQQVKRVTNRSSAEPIGQVGNQQVKQGTNSSTQEAPNEPH